MISGTGYTEVGKVLCMREKKREGGMIVELESKCPTMTYAKPYAKGMWSFRSF